MKHAFAILALLAIGCPVLAQETASDEKPTTAPVVPEVAEDVSHYEQLKAIEWMIGDWGDNDEKTSVSTSCKWTKNRNFISRSFSIQLEGCEPLVGMQIIGWDPDKKTIRSWMFDSEGGFGSATWTPNGKQWTIRASQILKNGEHASAVNVLTYVDDNSFKWRSSGREVDGQLLPNVPEVTVVRKTDK